MQIDQTVLDKIENDLTERVETKARKNVFKAYIAMGSLVLVVAGYFNYNFLQDIKTRVNKEIEDIETRANARISQRLGPRLEEADTMVQELHLSIKESEARYEVIEGFLRKRQDSLLTAELLVRKNELSLERMSLEVANGIVGVEKTLADTESQIAALQQRSSELAGAGNLDALNALLGTLTEQVAILDMQVTQIAESAALGGEISASGANKSALAGVLTSINSEFNDPQPTQEIERARVFFQFAGSTRGVAEEISKRLKIFGYEMPGEERLAAAASLAEVRYFFDEDEESARELVKHTDSVLSDMGLEIRLKLAPFTSYSTKKPRRGTLELWLEPR